MPITHIHRCHLLDYEHQLLSIVLSHCHYSLTIGKGQNVTYDYHALEKHILDRFIHGKPLILSDIPQVVYRNDVYTSATFATVRKKVHPQVRCSSFWPSGVLELIFKGSSMCTLCSLFQETLSLRIRKEILQELHSADRLKDALDTVDIVLGFLSSGGGKANRPLGEYIKHVLKMKEPFCQKVSSHNIIYNSVFKMNDS